MIQTSSRLFYAGACEGQMPEILTMIQIQRLTPTPAVLIMAILSLFYLFASDIYALINYVGFATWLSIGVGVLCLPWLRWKEPNLARPIRVPLFFPVIYLLATIFVVVSYLKEIFHNSLSLVMFLFTRLFPVLQVHGKRALVF
jgi:L-type amino acid transporter 8